MSLTTTVWDHLVSYTVQELVDLDVQESLLKSKAYSQMALIKRIRNEERSNYGQLPILNKQFLLLELLGKGGFSEVWKVLYCTDRDYEIS